jgi:mevalonate kinase
MAQTISKAPGKIILFGEHAVVYGQPAIAVPIPQRYATVTIEPIIHGDKDIQIVAPDIGLHMPLSAVSDDLPFALICNLVKEHGKLHHLPAMKIHIHSTIPVAAGLGSGAAVSVALARALCTFLGVEHTDSDISQIAFEAEKVLHGNPSGIDNTVIAYKRGIYYQKEHPIQWISIKDPIHLLIVNSGKQKSTKIMVDMVAQQIANNPLQTQEKIRRIGNITMQAKEFLAQGNLESLGKAMLENHQLLQDLGVSTPDLDLLVEMAMKNNAYGAKLSGAGGGGNMIILGSADTLETIEQLLHQAGFPNTIQAMIN